VKAILIGMAIAFSTVTAGSAYAETTIIKKRGHAVHKKIVIKHHGGMTHKKVVIKHRVD
jgi:hypothetical protein